MSDIKISPSILSADFSKLGREIQDLEKAKADLIHIDVMDGHFVPNITIGPEVIKKMRKYTKLPFDVHLMISPVHKFIKNFADAGADIITIHPEATDNLETSIRRIYTGSAGYIKSNGDMSFNICIRTLLKIGSEYQYGVGGGIVWDSVAIEEWNEAHQKSKILGLL